MDAKTQSSLLPYIETTPKINVIGSVIWLHGLGADGNDFKPIVPELNLPANLPLRFIFPHAPLQPVTINNGYVMRAWYDIVSLKIDEHADQKGIQNSVRQLERLIENEEKRGIPAEKIVLAGFSQGAVIALATGLCFTRKLAGILALSGYLPHAEQVIAKASPANQATPIFIGHGTEDTIVPFFLGHTTYETLKKHAYQVSWHSYPMPHSVCASEIKDISDWLQAVFNK